MSERLRSVILRTHPREISILSYLLNNNIGKVRQFYKNKLEIFLSWSIKKCRQETLFIQILRLIESQRELIVLKASI